jgi:hypothetical protein
MIAYVKNKAAQKLGSKGGKKTASRRTPKQRSEAARKAVTARWKKWRARKKKEGKQ